MYLVLTRVEGDAVRRQLLVQWRDLVFTGPMSGLMDPALDELLTSDDVRLAVCAVADRLARSQEVIAARELTAKRVGGGLEEGEWTADIPLELLHAPFGDLARLVCGREHGDPASDG